MGLLFATQNGAQYKTGAEEQLIVFYRQEFLMDVFPVFVFQSGEHAKGEC